MTLDYYQNLINHHIAFERLGHPAVWHMADAEKLDLDCLVVKSLLLRDHRSGRNYLLLCAPAEKVAFGVLAKVLQTSRSQLKIAKAAELQSTLHTVSGMVSPLILEPHAAVTVIISTQLRNQERLGMHAGTNTETVVLSYQSLLTFLRVMQIEWQVFALAGLAQG